MKHFDPEVQDSDDDEACDDYEVSSNDDSATVMAIPQRKATWREIEKRRELLMLSRMIEENIDDHIFN